MIIKSIKVTCFVTLLFSLLYLVLLNGCETNQPDTAGPDGHVAFGKLTIESDTLNGEIIRCPINISGHRPYHLGDTITVSFDQPFSYSDVPIITNQSVVVKVTSKFGDIEYYVLDPGYWPCESRGGDVQVFHSVIFYVYSLDSPSIPHPNNGFLEIKPTGDTIIASIKSFSSSDTLRDTVALLPK